MTTLAAQSVTLGYRTAPPVLSDVSFSVTTGQVTALIGPNAAGKSTLLRCLARAHSPASGRVTIGGDDLYRLPARDAARRIAFVAQENPMPFAFTVAELVAMGAAVTESEQRIHEALNLFDLGDLTDRSLLTLSGGERQRAALARAFAQNTPFLLLDEPTLHLDLRHQAALLRAARNAAHRGGRGVLLVLHDINQAVAVADTLILLHNNGIAASGDSQTVVTAERLRAVYQTNVRITSDPDTGLPRIHLPNEMGEAATGAVNLISS